MTESEKPSIFTAKESTSSAAVRAWLVLPAERSRSPLRREGVGEGDRIAATAATYPLASPPSTPLASHTLACGLEAETTRVATFASTQAPPATTTLTPLGPPLTTPTIKRKRPGPPASNTSTPAKRPRLSFLGRRTSQTFPTGFGTPPLQPPSPLFFSNSPHPRPRPALPPRFTSSEAAASMLGRTNGEDRQVRKVSLARGMVLGPTSGGSGTSSGSGMGLYDVQGESPGFGGRETGSSPAGTRRRRSEDVGANSVLASIGMLELLEQDERPTFVVDLSDSSNYGAGPLCMSFANASLRGVPGLASAVVESTGEDYLQFKTWVLSATVAGKSVGAQLPRSTYAGWTWSCSTVRGRLRVIAGSFAADKLPVSRPKTPRENTSAWSQETVVRDSREPSDYFAGAIPNATSSAPSATAKTSTGVSTALRNSIESKMSTPNRTSERRGSAGAEGRRSSERQPLTPGAMSTASSHHSTIDDLSSITDLLPHAAATSVPTPTSLPSAEALADAPPSHIDIVPANSPSFDWTRLPVTTAMPPHIQFARSIAWEQTSLGPIELWSSDLRQMCNLIMASPHPAAMYWGPDLIAIYNEAYILLAGQKHPSLMGQSYKDAWAEIWDDVKDVFANARVTGEATMKDDDCLFIQRNGFLEETYFSWSIIPMVGSNGGVMGLYNPAFEKTRRKIAERRMLTLREVGERTASARDVKAFWKQVIGSFEVNEFDSPCLLLYSVADEADSDASSMHSSSAMATRQCFLEGTLGVPEDHIAAPDQIDLRDGMEGFGPVFREVMKTDRPVVLEAGNDGDLPPQLLDNLAPRGFRDQVRAVVVCPIHPTTGDVVLGFLVLGINPRRPYDDDYALFVQLLSRQLATSLASVVLFEEEIRRGQRAAKLAAQDRIELSAQLAQRTAEAIESETRFTRMAEFAPVGMFIAGSDGRITFANDTWYEISRVPRDMESDSRHEADSWMDAIHPQDRTLVDQIWEEVVVRKKPMSSEFRFKAQWEDRKGNRGDTWVLLAAYPEKYADGRLKGVFGSLTNISPQKWAEGLQTRKMEEAVEMKRQQENFIDITSHEMRNPLSAILQCSDEITNSLARYKDNDGTGMENIPAQVLASCLDAAQIINLCSQHQKRIVDDILTLSKLDSKLLLVTPVDAQPLTVVQRALKMHEGELQAADIQMRFQVRESWKAMGLDWVRFDPSRVLQVLINLTTNAIKFTGTEKKRTITVSIGASREKPTNRGEEGVKYFPTRSKRVISLDEEDWGHGDVVYVHFAVQDTGRGLNPEEKKMLFLRFSQASPRTHVQYGGSGLGLFISRELTELQGGEIGVESEAGEGSTFAFYVAARRSTPPPDTDGGTGVKRSPQKTNGVVGKQGVAVKKVLIVEDNLVNQRVLQKQLKNLGTEVHLANHGGEALDKLRKSTYWAANNGKGIELGVVLMDQEMPVMDGLTCTRKIRGLEAEGKLTGHVPIIAVTANARAEQVQTALDAGMVSQEIFRFWCVLPQALMCASRTMWYRSLSGSQTSCRR